MCLLSRPTYLPRSLIGTSSMLAAVAGMLLAPSATAQSSFSLLSARTYDNLHPEDQFSRATRVLSGPQFNGVLHSVTGSTPGPLDLSLKSAVATGTAQYTAGIVRLTADAFAASSVINYFRLAHSSTELSAGVNDRFRIHAATVQPGTTGQLTAKVRLEGAVGGTGTPSTVSDEDGELLKLGGYEAQWRASYSLNSLRIDSSGGLRVFSSAGVSGFQQFIYSDAGGSRRRSEGTNGETLIDLSFVFGQDIEAAVYAEAKALVTGQAGSSGRAWADLGNTVAWGGIVELRDGMGAIVNDYTAVSNSGIFDYRDAAVVPEPSALWLMLAGMAMLFCRRTNSNPGLSLDHQDEARKARSG